ncbi:PREDICTED: LOW QUALITY PROTEIN: putative uncharacterized protein WWC2-AS2 [Propithecus coquereli]|uniref:LOW QUALITY PROTEIN: putative uncharacterized protein WWC2-AS2 n=1 Tax=Propithecus coquereli TaxID=379532 RepID=UPI00063F6AD7|nr:PREDICTED: LOW QUALITY PROTEIN: putative uncharacterized protein WWC2-AS2 [Propithecus coquereli]
MRFGTVGKCEKHRKRWKPVRGLSRAASPAGPLQGAWPSVTSAETAGRAAESEGGSRGPRAPQLAGPRGPRGRVRPGPERRLGHPPPRAGLGRGVTEPPPPRRGAPAAGSRRPQRALCAGLPCWGEGGWTWTRPTSSPFRPAARREVCGRPRWREPTQRQRPDFPRPWIRPEGTRSVSHSAKHLFIQQLLRSFPAPKLQPGLHHSPPSYSSGLPSSFF